MRDTLPPFDPSASFHLLCSAEKEALQQIIQCDRYARGFGWPRNHLAGLIRLQETYSNPEGLPGNHASFLQRMRAIKALQRSMIIQNTRHQSQLMLDIMMPLYGDLELEAKLAIQSGIHDYWKEMYYGGDRIEGLLPKREQWKDFALWLHSELTRDLRFSFADPVLRSDYALETMAHWDDLRAEQVGQRKTGPMSEAPSPTTEQGN
ncbi:hypothetical protein BDR26DRAFT_977208 [Obelidium mucronatum]|nr:hypothetical protein BDR26DRAFT_977208 [Obelidium mucronatum]